MKYMTDSSWMAKNIFQLHRLHQICSALHLAGFQSLHMIAGYRIGWMILSGNKSIAKDYMEGLNMLSNMRLCSNVPAQSIVQTALGGHQSVNGYIVPGGRIYEQREYIYKALNDIPGISAVKPKQHFIFFLRLIQRSLIYMMMRNLHLTFCVRRRFS